ncbi:MAG TPA: GGDEF domain-containing protein, partial [Piscirickettsiaceae bacterium]|nr:GGDEF domain-containing protein [Piscirickettsiaceae bacterium]
MSVSDAPQIANVQVASSQLSQLLAWEQQIFAEIMAGRDKQGLLNALCEQLNALWTDAQTLVLKQHRNGRIEILAAPSLGAQQRRQLAEMMSNHEDPCLAGLNQPGLQIIEDIRQDTRWNKVHRLDSPLEIISCWSQAIEDAAGQPRGVLAVAFSQSRRPDPLAQQLLRHAAQLAALMLHVHSQTQQLRQLLERDPLTHLYNRQRLKRDIKGLFQRQEPFGCLYIDLDHFKDIIDAHGHGVGDRVLVEVARRLEGCLMDMPGRLYRFGGDEFVMITDVCQLPEPMMAMEQLCARILERLQQPMIVAEKTFSLSASIGISCGVEAGADYYELLRMADAAMWSAKQAGRRTWRFFQQDMVDHLEEELRLEVDL